MRFSSYIFLFLSTLFLSISTLTLTGDEVWIVSINEDESFQLALRDLQLDWYKTLGYTPIILTYPNEQGPLINTTLLFLGTPEKSTWLSQFPLSTYKCLTGWESHCVFVTTYQGNPAIVATGSGVRGAIFAAFTISELILKVDPWWYWADHEPAYVGRISVADNFNVSYAPPLFKFRGWFSNDEDLNGNWRPDPMGRNVFDLETFDQYYQALLRLKGNMFLVGTVPYPDELSIRLASRRGLAVTHHHFNLLGMNTFRWPLGNDQWNWDTNPQTMSYVWKAGIDAQKDLEVLWSVGLRGLNDYPYPCNSDAECAKAIDECIGNQTQWVLAVQPDALIVTYTWDEMLNYLKEGLLILPPQVKVVFSDNGAGSVNGLDDLQYAHGLYYHTAMLNGVANQLTEMIPPSRIFDQIGQFIKGANETIYLIDNLSDLRPVLLSSEAFIRFSWDPTPYLNNVTPLEAEKNYLITWSQREFEVNVDIATQIAGLFTQYYQIPYLVNGHSDNYFTSTMNTLGTDILNDLVATGTVSTNTINLAKQDRPTSTPIVQSLYEQSLILFSQIPLTRQNFYQTYILSQQAIQLYSCLALQNLCDAVTAIAGQNSTQGIQYITESLNAFDSIFAAQRAAEVGGKWRGLYRGDTLVNFQWTRRLIRKISFQLNKVALPYQQNSTYYEFYNYQFTYQNNYPLINYNANYNLNSYVRISCTNNPICQNLADGGIFTTSAVITMAILMPKVSIYYTTDGSDPTIGGTSRLYTNPITITSTTQIKSRGFDSDQTPLSVLTNLTFTQKS